MNRQTQQPSLTLDSGQVPGLWPDFTWRCTQPAPATPLWALLLHQKSPGDLTGQKALSSVSPRGVGRGWRPYDVLQGVCLGWAMWMHRISHPNIRSATYEHFFRLVTEPSLGFQPCPMDPISRCAKAGWAGAEHSGNETSWGEMTSKCSAVFSPDLILISFEWFCA